MTSLERGQPGMATSRHYTPQLFDQPRAQHLDRSLRRTGLGRRRRRDVFSPIGRRIRMLPNPFGKRGRGRYRELGGSLRYAYRLP